MPVPLPGSLARRCRCCERTSRALLPTLKQGQVLAPS